MTKSSNSSTWINPRIAFRFYLIIPPEIPVGIRPKSFDGIPPGIRAGISFRMLSEISSCIPLRIPPAVPPGICALISHAISSGIPNGIFLMYPGFPPKTNEFMGRYKAGVDFVWHSFRMYFSVFFSGTPFSRIPLLIRSRMPLGFFSSGILASIPPRCFFFWK